MIDFAFNFWPLITGFMWCMWLYAFCLAYRAKNKKTIVFLLLLGVVICFSNPVRFKQHNMSKIEGPERTMKFLIIPDRVVADSLSFIEKQKQEMVLLKEQSTHLETEISN